MSFSPSRIQKQRKQTTAQIKYTSESDVLRRLAKSESLKKFTLVKYLQVNTCNQSPNLEISSVHRDTQICLFSLFHHLYGYLHLYKGLSNQIYSFSYICGNLHSTAFWSYFLAEANNHTKYKAVENKAVSSCYKGAAPQRRTLLICHPSPLWLPVVLHSLSCLKGCNTTGGRPAQPE